VRLRLLTGAPLHHRRCISPEMDVATARLLGEMAAHPPMRRFFWTEELGTKTASLLKRSA